jgi:hypothetical protein
VHSGFLKTAENVLENIEQNDALRVLQPDQAYENYSLTICGHSLGAAVGSLLTYFLRMKGYTRARCYAFNPPGMMLTRLAADYFDGIIIPHLIIQHL